LSLNYCKKYSWSIKITNNLPAIKFHINKLKISWVQNESKKYSWLIKITYNLLNILNSI